MPLPLIFIIPASLTIATGIVKSIEANVDMKDANNTNAKASAILENAKANLEMHRKACSKALEALGDKKIYTLNASIPRFIHAVEKIKNVELSETAGLKELDRFCIDKKAFSELKEMSGYVSSLLGGASAGVLSGALTAFGAWGAAGTLATASTGTAIAALHGAAATNATLAFFGGGSLAAGGLGMAGGAVVLGGLVTGPALAVMGFIIEAKASEQRERAYANLAEAERISEELALASLECDGIRRRCNMFYNLLIRLDAQFTPSVFKLQETCRKRGSDYRRFSNQEKKMVAATFSLAGAIKAVLDTPILSEDGKLTEESGRLLEEIPNAQKSARQALPVTCPKCGHNDIYARNFCSRCGTKL